MVAAGLVSRGHCFLRPLMSPTKKKKVKLLLLSVGQQCECPLTGKTLLVTQRASGNMVEVQDAWGKLWAWPASSKVVLYG